MTESTFPFAPDDDAAGTKDGVRDRKAFLVAGGLAALLLVGGGAYVLTSGGDPAEEAFVPPKRAPKSQVVAAAKPQPAVAKLPSAVDIKLGRDPFRALALPPAAGAGAAVGGGGAPAAGAPTSGQPAGAPAPGPKEYGLKLVKVSTPTADDARLFTFSIEGKTVTVVPAQRFGKYGELVVLAFTKNAKGAVTGAVVQVGDDNPLEIGIGKTEAVL